jgi:ferredoxin-NADP reductase
MITKILMTEFVTHDVKRFVLEKPEGYIFTPGQATDVAINQKGWEDKTHPFTFTSLNDDLVLEFTIKGYPISEYPNHEGMTEKLHTLLPGDELILEDPWGTINYKGKGVFIAGGAGITPFIAIFRQLERDRELKGNKLFFSNKTSKDIILEKEFVEMFEKDDLVLTLTYEEKKDYVHGRIGEKFLKTRIKDFSQHFYVCGPSAMVKEVKSILKSLGASSDSVVFEE